jgi:hypothetical protein
MIILEDVLFENAKNECIRELLNDLKVELESLCKNNNGDILLKITIEEGI